LQSQSCCKSCWQKDIFAYATIHHEKQQIKFFCALNRGVIHFIRALPPDSFMQTITRDNAIQNVKQNAPVKIDDGNSGLSPHDYKKLHFSV